MPGRQSLKRLRRGLQHSLHLVAAVAFHVLFESLLRSVGAKFLSVFSGLHRHHAAGALAGPSCRVRDRYASGSALTSSALLCPLTLAFGRIDTPIHTGAQANLVLIVSAVSCITLAHVLYYVAIHQIGVALAQTFQLLCPAIAMALSAWIFHEQLTPAQLWSAAVLLLGAFLAMRVKPVATSEAAENI